MNVFKKRKEGGLDPEKAEIYRTMGEAFAEKLRLREGVEKINEYGSKKPKQFFSLLFILLVICFVINSIAYSDRVVMENVTPKVKTDNSLIKEEQIKADIKNEMHSLYEETEFLMDTLSKVMSKPVMTAADSLFVAQKMARLEAINNILNQSYGDADTKED